ncbi:Dyp-type peroxidase [Acidocella sp. MX-AZ03]|uniref:Dyp-type peroxidase n=1 Tax=Acidocella sp. MX-AZ03 TaxID=2697363 RepID=UPI0022DE3816|nr:Dyp-type peroxidase [Acidocella sp. MX-AZ03]WBO58142.1 Dyp-type peroxidase [Acidocella sp. MX-AZ03]
MSTDTPKAPSRRRFLGTAGLAGAAASLPAAAAARMQAAGTTLPFYGPRQQGITTPMQSALYFASFDLETEHRAELIVLLQRWTAASARMTAGLPAEPGTQQEDEPGLDSGEALGLTPARLTLTFGFGPDLFTLNGKDRYGLAARRPAALVDLPAFNGDQLVAGQCGGALCVQACADDPQVAFHAVRQLSRLAYGTATLKWVQTGFSTAPRSKGTPRNLMGFKDGTMNPTGHEMDAVVWAGADAGWMQNGSYMVARRIRIALEHWDRMKVGFQEQTFGRHKASGAPLGGTREFDTPNFNATDSDGNYVIPQTAHARLGAAALNDGAQILRRSYGYNNGADFTAERWPPWTQGIEFESGLFFQAYQKDPRNGFIKIFDKMSKFDALNQFTTHVGSAVFACPPGAQPGSYIGAPLFAA